MLNVLYILEALRHNYIMPGYLRLSLWCVRWEIFPPADRVTGYTGECLRCFVFMKV